VLTRVKILIDFVSSRLIPAKTYNGELGLYKPGLNLCDPDGSIDKLLHHGFREGSKSMLGGTIY
jgi:hypothetical protein